MRVRALVASLCLSVAGAAAAAEPDAILGTWRTEDGDGNRDGIVEIRRRGDEYYATIVWSKYRVYPPEDPKGMAGRPVVDRENPDPALRERPILGIENLHGLRFDGEAWVGGTVYSPRDGSTHSARVELDDADMLKVRGYIGTPWLGRTVTWIRESPPSSRPISR